MSTNPAQHNQNRHKLNILCAYRITVVPHILVNCPCGRLAALYWSSGVLQQHLSLLDVSRFWFTKSVLHVVKKIRHMGHRSLLASEKKVRKKCIWIDLWMALKTGPLTTFVGLWGLQNKRHIFKTLILSLPLWFLKPAFTHLFSILQNDGLWEAVQQCLSFRLFITNMNGVRTSPCALFKIHQTLITKLHVKINQSIIKASILSGFSFHQWHSTIYEWGGGDYSVWVNRSRNSIRGLSETVFHLCYWKRLFTCFLFIINSAINAANIMNYSLMFCSSPIPEWIFYFFNHVSRYRSPLRQK